MKRKPNQQVRVHRVDRRTGPRGIPGQDYRHRLVTSNGLAKFIEERGGVHRRFKRGYKNVIDEAKRINAEGGESHLAMETSGHGAIKENYFLDDGSYLAMLARQPSRRRKRRDPRSPNISHPIMPLSKNSKSATRSRRRTSEPTDRICWKNSGTSRRNSPAGPLSNRTYVASAKSGTIKNADGTSLGSISNQRASFIDGTYESLI